MTAVSYTTVARLDPDGVLLIEVPAHVVAALSDKKRVPVTVTLNGVSYRSTIAVYGGKFYWRSQQRTQSGCADSLPARREIRDAAKLAPGERAHVTLEADTPRAPSRSRAISEKRSRPRSCARHSMRFRSRAEGNTSRV